MSLCALPSINISITIPSFPGFDFPPDIGFSLAFELPGCPLD